MKLRSSYQLPAVKNVMAAFEDHQRVLLVSPTGSGKSVMGAHVVKRMRGVRCLWVAHRIELLRQARAELIAAGIPERYVGIMSGTDKENAGARVMVCSIEMAKRAEPEAFGLVVVDEAHRAEARSYKAVVEAQGCKLLGLTATPWRLDGRSLGETFEHMVVAGTPTQLEVDGFVARPVTYGVPQEKAKELVAGLSGGGGDYSAAELAKRMGTRRLLGDVVDETQRIAADRRTIVFAVDRKHGKALAARFRRCGRSVAYLDGETPAIQRSKIIDGLASGEVDIIVNVDVLTEGFDCPPVQCVSIARPTKSLTRFLQYCGRASRPWGDERPLILDHGGNCWRFGLPNDDRDWTLDRGKKKPPTPDVKQCANVECGAMIPLGCKECPECGEEQPRTPHEQRELEEKEAELVRLRENERKKFIARERFTKRV